METIYTAYTKDVQGKTYYFVKKFLKFPEYKEVDDILEGYGMHTDFNKACNIAGIYEPVIRKKLLGDVKVSVPQAKIIDLKYVSAIRKKIGF